MEEAQQPVDLAARVDGSGDLSSVDVSESAVAGGVGFGGDNFNLDGMGQERLRPPPPPPTVFPDQVQVVASLRRLKNANMGNHVLMLNEANTFNDEALYILNDLGTASWRTNMQEKITCFERNYRCPQSERP